ncbi:uracil phosphoribosyltransferase [Phototrophicus methaneseepsis]|uniref:Uracil phosphoribosyltransferase n=1 Tax=Phototrophicus methaneseepsis TaxID=2710758 RepID=A0A7S8E687_9CHLR|nr:uracil phosphoribosyltransferase [Phototrophicus methaneseepsis]QPC81153.1 uracil phosphoribosyltransferase [Phototrophicus methaneseepsis]
MQQLHVSEHPLVKHKLTALRATSTDHRTFRELVRELSMLLCYEATLDMETKPKQVVTPMGETTGAEVKETIGLVPIMRAGIGMTDGIMELLPSVQVWHIGLYRDEETLRPVSYYNKLPQAPTVQVCLVLDPMLATGGSAIATVNILKEWGVARIKYVGLLAAPEGVEAFSSAHPDVPIHVAALDERLNDIGFIVPGLGDAGDRMFGT